LVFPAIFDQQLRTTGDIPRAGDEGRSNSRYLTTGLMRIGEKSIGLDFNKDLRRDQAAYLDYAGCRADVGKEFAMRAAYFFPVVDIRDIDSSPNDMSQSCSGPRQREFDILQDLD